MSKDNEFEQASVVPHGYDDSARDSSSAFDFDEKKGILFEQAMSQTRMAVCLSDPSQPDTPIVFCNDAFRNLTGYSGEEIIGRNCRFLQGEETDPESVEIIRQALAAEEVAVVELVNYKKDGTKFWNALHIGPIYEDGKLRYFYGSQWDVTNVRTARADREHARQMARELSHRIKNILSVIMSLIKLSGRLYDDQRLATEINDRIDALGRAYEMTLDGASRGTILVSEAVEAVLSHHLEEQGRLELEGPETSVPFTTISLLSLLLHELSTEASERGVWSDDDVKVRIDWGIDDQNILHLNWTEESRSSSAEEAAEASSGQMLVERMLRSAGGAIERSRSGMHTVARITLPIVDTVEQ